MAFKHKANRKHKAPKKPKKRVPRLPRTPLPLFVNDQQVLTVREWCQLNAFGERTGRRILKSSNGPLVTHLSANRLGITVGANKRWQEARSRPSQ